MASRPEPPVKLWYRIGEVADIVGVEPHVLRYWETEFRSIRPTKSAKGQRVYSRRDVDALVKVKDLLYGHGFTIQGARRKLREGGVEPMPPPPPAAVNQEEIERLRGVLLTLRSELTDALQELDSL